MLGDGRVDDAASAEFLQQALGDLIGALIFRDFLAHDEHIRVTPHFLGHGVAQRVADGLRDELGTFRHLRLGLADGSRRSRMGCGLRLRCFRFRLCRCCGLCCALRRLTVGVVGADVVALLVVGVLAIELAVLGRDFATLGGLLD